MVVDDFSVIRQTLPIRSCTPKGLARRLEHIVYLETCTAHTRERCLEARCAKLRPSFARGRAMRTGVSFTGAAGQTGRSDTSRSNREGLVIKTSPDVLDEEQHAAEREMTIGNLIPDSSVLRNVRRALRHIEESSLGVYLHCEEDVGPKRLAAVPVFMAICPG
jgi:RNA polymerase-binding transcription factor DksA